MAMAWSSPNAKFAEHHAFVRHVALALTAENPTRSLSAVIMMTSVGKTFLFDRDERLPKDLRPVVALGRIYGSAFKRKGSRGQMAAPPPPPQPVLLPNDISERCS